MTNTKYCPSCERDLDVTLFREKKDGKRDNLCIACNKYRLPTEEQLRDKAARFRKHQKYVDWRGEAKKPMPPPPTKEDLMTAEQRAAYKEKRKQFLKYARAKDPRTLAKEKLPKMYIWYLEYLEKNYPGVDEQGIRDIMDAQLGCCEACGVSLYLPDSTHFPFLDTYEDEVRGLLCTSCTIVLAYSDGSIDRLAGVTEYIRSYNG